MGDVGVVPDRVAPATSVDGYCVDVKMLYDQRQRLAIERVNDIGVIPDTSLALARHRTTVLLRNVNDVGIVPDATWIYSTIGRDSAIALDN